MNKDLILREFLAIERTKLANQTTFLAYIRTGLYFIVAGTTLGAVVDTTFWTYMAIPMTSVGLIIILVGIFSYRVNNRRIVKSAANVGNIKADFLTEMGIDVKSVY
jgi:putative membrane protein